MRTLPHRFMMITHRHAIRRPQPSGVGLAAARLAAARLAAARLAGMGLAAVRLVAIRLAVIALASASLAPVGPAAAAEEPASRIPVTPAQRSTARQVADAGVPLSELAANAPDDYTVKRGDTLWDISRLFLNRPWRWPELWGMNLAEIRNPHLIYPGQVLVLDKSGDRARLRLGRAVGDGDTVKLSPKVRSSPLPKDAIASIPFHLIEPFLSEAVIFDSDALATAPRIVAAQENRVLLSRGEKAYVLGLNSNEREWRIFRAPKPMKDPDDGRVLGYEAAYVGTAEYVRSGEPAVTQDAPREAVPATMLVTDVKQEANVGDRLAPLAPREFTNYAPHEPASPLAGRIVSIYGNGLYAGQNQIVALNRGAADGVERGHVLALWHDGAKVADETDPRRATIKLPDERQGLLFVFRVFDRMSYALILSVNDPVKAGDRFTQP